MFDPSFFDEISDVIPDPSREDDSAGDDATPSDALSSYMLQIRKYPIPGREEERNLLVLANQGDERARHDLVTRNLRLVVMFVTRVMRRWKPLSVSRADLIQAGNIGLMEAIDNFDAEKFGVRFSTYAAWHINKQIWRTLKFEDRLVRLPVYLEDRLGDYLLAVSAFRSESGRDPTASEVAAKLGISPDEARKLGQLPSGVLSLDASIGASDGDLSVVDAFPSDDVPQDEHALWSEAASVLETALGCLSDDDRTMLLEHVGIHDDRKSSPKIGEERGMSSSNVRLRISGAKTRIRARLKREGFRKEHFL